MGSPVRIRRLEPNDVPAALHIVRANWSEATAQSAHVEFGQAFSSAVWRPIFYAAEEDGRVVGTAGYAVSWMQYGVYDITWVNVQTDRQRDGIGRMLVSQCLDDIRAVGSLAMLSTKVPDYYARWWGFVRCFEHDGYVFMRLALADRP